MRVLIVEDSARLRESLTTGLRCSGFSVDTVADAESALPFLRTASYPLVVLDLSLPGMDGVALLKLMRREKPVKQCLCFLHATTFRTALKRLIAAPMTIWSSRSILTNCWRALMPWFDASTISVIHL